jgi:hypothetical protein
MSDTVDDENIAFLSEGMDQIPTSRKTAIESIIERSQKRYPAPNPFI